MSGIAGLGLALKFAKVKDFLAKIPWQVYVVFALVVLIGVGACVHGNKVESFGQTRYNEGFTEGQARLKADMKKLQDQLAAKTAPIVADEKDKLNAKDRTSRNAADSLRVRGPGKAVCPNPATVSRGAGGHAGADRPADAPVAGVPSSRGEYIALPFADTISFTEHCDLYRNRVETWNSWYNRLAAEWYKAMAEAAEGQK